MHDFFRIGPRIVNIYVELVCLEFMKDINAIGIL